MRAGPTGLQHRISVVAAVSCLLACERAIERPGQVVVVLDTDMALPEQVDTLHIEVSSGGRVQLQNEYSVGVRRDHAIPATLAITGNGAGAQPVTVRVAGSKLTPRGLEWRTYREATTTVPTNRIATLRMPIQWLCKGQVESVPPDDPDSPLETPHAQSTCGAHATCKAGHCQPSNIDLPDLPDYTPELTYGGGATPEQGSCFDTAACMVRGGVVEPDADCTIRAPDSPDINVALRVAKDGICDSVGVNCFVPLNGLDHEGWTYSKDRKRLVLPVAVCEKLGEGVVRAVYVSTACRTKTADVPACGPWSDVPKGDAGEYRPQGEVSVSATSFTRVPNGGERCCPLMADSNKLYACVCAQDESATLFEIDPARSEDPQTISAFNPSGPMDAPLATVVYDHALYWVAERSVRRTPLPGSTQLAMSFEVPGALYYTGSLLVDDAGIYALASGVSGSGSPVRLIAIDPATEAVVAFETGGNGPVFQFDHDAAAVYLAVDRDRPLPNSKRVDRSSSVVRIAKRGGERSTVMPERTLRIDEVDQGGYLGVRLAGDSVIALFEDAPGDDRTVTVRIHRARKDADGGDPEELYSVATDPERKRLRLLGEIDGCVFATQLELDDGEVVGASLLMLPPDGSAPRIVADFARDYPVQGLAFDADNVYWLNNSGAVYRLPRASLR
ncbi:MAG TPA: hypothetical protein VJR89_07080 [Polyangiales bacterium]|nr:hypothetical protein [Polyangiales bacterium]